MQTYLYPSFSNFNFFLSSVVPNLAFLSSSLWLSFSYLKNLTPLKGKVLTEACTISSKFISRNLIYAPWFSCFEIRQASQALIWKLFLPRLMGVCLSDTLRGSQHKHKATPIFMHPDSSSKTSWHIYILANYTNYYGRSWIKIIVCNFIHVAWGIGAGMFSPWAAPFGAICQLCTLWLAGLLMCRQYKLVTNLCTMRLFWFMWKSTSFFCVSGWQDAAILLAFAKRVLCAGAAPQIAAAQFVLLHYVKDTKKLKAGKGLSNLVM